MSVESIGSYPSFPVSDATNRLMTRKQRREERREYRREHPRRHKLLKSIGSFTLATGLLYGLDVTHGMENLKNTKSSIISVLPARSPLDSNKAIVDSAGWGNLNAYDTASALPTFADDGNLWAIRYDNTGLDTNAIADQLVQKAHEEGVDEVSFSGHSMGGLVSLEVARKIYEGHNDISVPYIVLDCTPANIDAVRPDVRSDGFLMANALSNIPGARESSAIRFIAEEGARFRQYEDLSSPLLIDPVKFARATRRVIDNKFLDEDAASTSLLDSQFDFIVGSGAKDNILALGKDNGKPKPILIYLRPEDASADRTVDNDYSQQQFEHYARQAGLMLIVIDIKGTQHADPIERPREYNTMLASTLLPRITREQILAEEARDRESLRQEEGSTTTTILSDPQSTN